MSGSARGGGPGAKSWCPLWLVLLGGMLTVQCASFGAAAQAPPLPPGFKLLYEQQFDDKSALTTFRMSDPSAWKLSSDSGNGTLELAAQSKYEPPVRSPINIALIGDKIFGDFILEADLMQTGKEYGHRDMCVFFGVQAPNKFYYAHLATAADDHAHNIFIVNGAPRVKVADETTKGVNWGLGVWHKVRIERTVADGSIRVFFDDIEKPIMAARNTAFTQGYVGFGSFDDTGRIDNVRIWGLSAQEKKADFFKQPQPERAPAN